MAAMRSRAQRSACRSSTGSGKLAPIDIATIAADPELQVLAAELGVAGERHRPHPEAGEHRDDPLDAAADQGHHSVPALDTARCHRAG